MSIERPGADIFNPENESAYKNEKEQLHAIAEEAIKKDVEIRRTAEELEVPLGANTEDMSQAVREASKNRMLTVDEVVAKYSVIPKNDPETIEQLFTEKLSKLRELVGKLENFIKLTKSKKEVETKLQNKIVENKKYEASSIAAGYRNHLELLEKALHKYQDDPDIPKGNIDEVVKKLHEIEHVLAIEDKNQTQSEHLGNLN